MRRYTASSFRQPIIVDPLKEDVELTDYTAKIFPLVLTPGNERLAYVIEQASFFYRRTSNGLIEKVPKSSGKGYAGGGSKQGETPIETAIREGNEELGASIETLKRLTRPNIVYTTYAGDAHPFHLFFTPVDEKDVERGFINRALITDWKLVGKKAGWAKLRELWGSLIAPADKTEREEYEARGTKWFYHGHTVLLVAMLIRLVKTGVISGEQSDLPWAVYRQISPHQCVSYRMVKMIIEEGRTDLLEMRLPRFMGHKGLAALTAFSLVEHRLDDLLSDLVSRTNPTWRDELERHVQKALELRDAKSAPRPFESFDDMMAFHANMSWESEATPALADPSVRPSNPRTQEED